MGFFRRSSSRITTLNRVVGAADTPEVDIVFVHGLNEDWRTTWGFDQLANLATVLADGVPTANIWSLDYRVDWSRWKGGSTSLFQRANGVLAELDFKLRGDRPILMIGHSYGGLLIKKLFQVAEVT